MGFSRLQLHTLIPGMLLCGILSVFFGKELCWDLANYHFYNPYALLYGRSGMDYWPACNIHQYINPAIDLLTWFLIQSFTPRMAEFILGALSGLNLWLLFLIARFFLQKERFPSLFALSFALLGLCGSTTLPGIGSFQNDNLICILVLGFVLLQLQERMFLAGMLLGLGFGLKLTAGIYIAGGIAATLLMPYAFKDKCKFIFMMGLGIFIGMIITGGYWMLRMWQEHHNPFFPFLNLSSGGWRDTRFLPKDVWQTIFYPFYFSFDGRTADAPFRDFRFAVVYVLVVMAAFSLSAAWLGRLQSLARHQTLVGNKSKIRSRRQSIFFFSFFILSYLIWQHFFSIARYLAPLEMLAPLMIYLLLKELIKTAILRTIILFSLFSWLLLTLSPIARIRAPWYETSFFNVKMPASVTNTPEATVLMAFPAYVLNVNPRPQSYLIPFFPFAWHFIGIPFLNEKYMLDKHTVKTITTKLENPKILFLLTTDRNMPELFKAAGKFGLSPNGKCEKITSDRQAVTHQDVLLCPIRKF